MRLIVILGISCLVIVVCCFVMEMTLDIVLGLDGKFGVQVAIRHVLVKKTLSLFGDLTLSQWWVCMSAFVRQNVPNVVHALHDCVLHDLLIRLVVPCRSVAEILGKVLASWELPCPRW